MANWKKTFDRGIAYLKKNGLCETARRALRKVQLQRKIDYEKWLQKHARTAKEIRISEQKLAAQLARIQVVSWGQPANWQGAADYVLFVEEDGKLAPEALTEFAKALERAPQAEVIYSDSDRLAADGRHLEAPLMKPDFDWDLLCALNYIGPCFLVAARLLADVALQDPYEVLLRCLEKTKRVEHVSRVLYHASPRATYSLETQKEALQAHFMRLSVQAEILDGEVPGIRRIRYPLPTCEGLPLVSILIPNRDQPQLLKQCVRSIQKQAGYEWCEVLILENNSSQPETFACYEKLCAEDPHIRLLTWSGEFDFAQINQFGAKQAAGAYLLFLNNDTQMYADCLQELLRYAARADVGAVGARMYYADGSIQHAGVIVGYGGLAGHAFESMKKEQYRKIPWVLAARQYSAVTAACLMMKKELFFRLGGFCRELRVAYNDIDLCLRIREQGQKVIYQPYAQLLHLESQTRGLEMTREKARRVSREAEIFCRRWADILARGDPCYNPNLTLEKSDFSLIR